MRMGSGVAFLGTDVPAIELNHTMRIFGQHEENTIRQLQDVATRAERVALMADGYSTLLRSR